MRPDVGLLIEPTSAGQPRGGRGLRAPCCHFTAANPVGSLAEFLVLFDAIFTLNQDLLLEKHYRYPRQIIIMQAGKETQMAILTWRSVLRGTLGIAASGMLARLKCVLT